MYSFGNGSGVGKGTTEPRQNTPWLIESLEGEVIIDVATGDGHCLALTQRKDCVEQWREREGEEAVSNLHGNERDMDVGVCVHNTCLSTSCFFSRFTYTYAQIHVHPYTTYVLYYHICMCTSHAHLQEERYMPGALIAWVSVDRATAMGPLQFQAKLWAWKESRYSRSQLEPHTAWCGLQFH